MDSNQAARPPIGGPAPRRRQVSWILRNKAAPPAGFCGRSIPRAADRIPAAARRRPCGHLAGAQAVEFWRSLAHRILVAPRVTRGLSRKGSNACVARVRGNCCLRPANVSIRVRAASGPVQKSGPVTKDAGKPRKSSTSAAGVRTWPGPRSRPGTAVKPPDSAAPAARSKIRSGHSVRTLLSWENTAFLPVSALPAIDRAGRSRGVEPLGQRTFSDRSGPLTRHGRKSGPVH
jgi:hypothetical protein